MNPCVFFAQRHGLALCGVSDDSDDGGNAAYQAFLVGGRSGFNALLSGGGVSDQEQYARLEAHGFYWTASGQCMVLQHWQGRAISPSSERGQQGYGAVRAMCPGVTAEALAREMKSQRNAYGCEHSFGHWGRRCRSNTLILATGACRNESRGDYSCLVAKHFLTASEG